MFSTIHPNIPAVLSWASGSEVKEQVAHGSSALLGAHQGNAQILKEAVDGPARHLQMGWDPHDMEVNRP